jgi:hypothetical protein
VQGARYSENLLEPTSGSCPWVLREQAADFPPSGECRPPAYLNAYGQQLPDIESRLKRPRQLKPMRMAMKN